MTLKAGTKFTTVFDGRAVRGVVLAWPKSARWAAADPSMRRVRLQCGGVTFLAVKDIQPV